MSLEDAIAVQNCDIEKRTGAEKGKMVCLGLESRPGWSGELPFYLFKCPHCGTLVKDYLHGFPGYEYLNCLECGCKVNYPMKVGEHKPMGKRDFIARFLRSLWILVKLRFS